ncbi:MAG: hypothetical protein GKS01_12835 [Alphaproteobacteria bacterium]|nr:hypothetical protein [Alphaproteobacteria bacterium]
MWRIVSIGTILLTSAALVPIFSQSSWAQAEIKPDEPIDVREVRSRKTLIDCSKELDRRDGGWCHMDGASISDIFPKSLSQKIRMATGPSSVIRALNGAAFDSIDLKMYFHGGGSTDYGGNEVYELDLMRGRWTRLTDPPPLLAARKGVTCLVPRNGPPSSRTFDGIIFSKTTRTILVFPSVYSCRRGRFYPKRAIWEFNPSQTERRNGLAPLSWRQRAPMPQWMKRRSYRTAQYKDGSIYVGSDIVEAILNEKDGTWNRIGSRPNYRHGNSIYDASRDGIWSIHRSGLLFTKPPKSGIKHSVPGAGVSGYSGLAMMRDNKLIFWNGSDLIHTYDPQTRDWRVFDWGMQGPRYGFGVYSKWVRVPKFDVYVGYADHKIGAWVYRHPKKLKGTIVETNSIQSILDRASAESAVVVPPGIYRPGAVVNKSMKLDLKGVRILGTTKGKSVLLIQNAVGPVTVDNFRTTFRARCGNCAGLKIEGKNFNVRVRHAHIANAEMGILTDNRGGTLIVEDTIVEDIGHKRGREPMHLIYAGYIDKLRIVRSTLRRSHYFGHIVKSRARTTEISDSYLLGLGSRNSREGDMPCGGVIRLNRVVIQKGPHADNDESFGVGLEPQNCYGKLHPKTFFSLTNSWLIFDRPKGQFGQWRGPYNSKIRGNRIVGIQNWGSFRNYSHMNKLFYSRSAAGLEKNEIPRLSHPLPKDLGHEAGTFQLR